MKIGRWILLALILSAAVYGGVRAYRDGSGDVLIVDRISVIGAQIIPKSKIISISGIRMGMDMRRVSPNSISKRLLSHFRYLKRVKVSKGISGEVVIEVKERQPEAVLRSGNRYYLIDDEGFVLEEDVSPERFKGFKMIEGKPGIALAVMKYVRMLYPVLYERTTLVSAREPFEIVLHLEDGARILLNAEEIEEGLENAYLVDSIRRGQGEKGGYIDARYDKLVYCGGM